MNPAASLLAETPVSHQSICSPPCHLYLSPSHHSPFSFSSHGWLSALLTEKFFNPCIIHQDEKKNEKNVFCFDCCAGICPYCFAHHRSHRLLQVRRYMYHDVIRIREAEKLMDCAQVQYYKTNSAKVVFLNRRPPTRPSKACSNFCINCDKNLQDSYLFCCLFCKIQHLARNGSKNSMCNFAAFCEPGSEDGLLTPESVLELSGSGEQQRGLLITDIVTRKKRSNHLRSMCTPVYVMNRRKSTPHRSPLY
ncbi:protein RGF1 INDUCIBLE TRANSCRIPTION FACTOR 1-like [Salvia divinorum]|uniref:Protein RGF1 INDUCIBLE TRANSCRIPTION FACTOR 1-like n=1 Tax=Salvia divinorum TaxID=28513 RepID=A0ABD1GQS6_SALDI